ncbi:hypothetical protein [Phaeobacter sp.]|uniref:hypothetical protein n=1 Tax=Phaeobacter sp. TaxID=1902409 RepID=UPI0025F09443|nr:hypothetical protein [Phaeobacter sp.]
MKQKMLDQMASVTEAMYLREHAKVKPILDAEAHLRGQLSKLDRQVKETRDQAHDDLAMKALGADLLWQGWHSKTRRQLNMELAQVTARKLRAMDGLRKAFGRKHAVETMAQNQRSASKKATALKQHNRLMNLE